MLKSGGDKPDTTRRSDNDVLDKVVEFVGRQHVGALPWQDAALEMGDLVQTLGLI